MSTGELTFIDRHVVVACTPAEAIEQLDGADRVAQWFGAVRAETSTVIRSTWGRCVFERTTQHWQPVDQIFTVEGTIDSVPVHAHLTLTGFVQSVADGHLQTGTDIWAHVELGAGRRDRRARRAARVLTAAIRAGLEHLRRALDRTSKRPMTDVGQQLAGHVMVRDRRRSFRPAWNPTDVEPRSTRIGLARQVGLVTAGFVVYGAIRALTNGSEAAALHHASSILALESRLGLAIEQDLQQLVLRSSHLTSFFNVVYVWTYWPTLVSTLAFTWWRQPRLFYVFRDALLASGAVGLTIFALFPVAPPRFLDGFVDTVDAAQRSHFIAHPSLVVNRFAALPSFHIGWVALACAVLMLATQRRWLCGLLIVPPVLMTVAVIVTANHYVVDVAAGLAISLAGLAVSSVRIRANPNAERPQK